MKIDKKVMKDQKQFDIDIIKLNLLPTLLVNIVKGIFYGKEIIIISKQDFINMNFMNFFASIFTDSFDWEITFLPDNKDYRKNIKDQKGYLVLDGNKVIADQEKIINPKQMKIEKAIVNKFYMELDSESAIILFRNEIDKVQKICYEIIEFNGSLKEDEELISKDVLDHLKQIYNVEMPLPYLNFLFDVVESYFDVKLNRQSKAVDFVKFL